LKFNKNTYPAERYDDLLKFYKKIVRADKMKLVILGEDRP
jgi:predicted Zn-dependent peptidase